jgi:hypothetical protein
VVRERSGAEVFCDAAAWWSRSHRESEGFELPGGYHHPRSWQPHPRQRAGAAAGLVLRSVPRRRRAARVGIVWDGPTAWMAKDLQLRGFQILVTSAVKVRMQQRRNAGRADTEPTAVQDEGEDSWIVEDSAALGATGGSTNASDDLPDAAGPGSREG